MHGRSLLINILLLIMSWTILLPTVSYAVTGASEAPIAVLLSDSASAYNQVLKNFQAATNIPVHVFNLEGDVSLAPLVMEKILADPPALIFSLGAKAAVVAKIWTQKRLDIPVVFAMVSNWEKYNLLSQKNFTGIMTDVAPGTNFANITMVLPRIKKLGVIYSLEYSDYLIQEARKAAALLGIELIEETVTHSKEFKQRYKAMSEHIDGFWILTDPVIYTVNNISWLKTKCIQEHMACIGQSVNIAKMGFLLAIDPDLPHIGLQAAAIVKGILQHQKQPEDIGIVAPLGTNLILNLKTAARIGMTISEESQNLANILIE